MLKRCAPKDPKTDPAVSASYGGSLLSLLSSSVPAIVRVRGGQTLLGRRAGGVLHERQTVALAALRLAAARQAVADARAAQPVRACGAVLAESVRVAELVLARRTASQPLCALEPIEPHHGRVAALPATRGAHGTAAAVVGHRAAAPATRGQRGAREGFAARAVNRVALPLEGLQWLVLHLLLLFFFFLLLLLLVVLLLLLLL